MGICDRFMTAFVSQKLQEIRKCGRESLCGREMIGFAPLRRGEGLLFGEVWAPAWRAMLLTRRAGS